MLGSYFLASMALTPISTEAVRHVSGSNYIGDGAGVATVIALIGFPIWREARKSRKRNEHNAQMLDHVVAGVYGKGEQRENGVLVEPAVDGMLTRLDQLEAQIKTGSPAIGELSEKLDRHNTTVNDRLARNERAIAEARIAAGEAAVVAARVEDRLKLVNDRTWEWISELQARNEGLSAALHELGYDVAALPSPGDGPHVSDPVAPDAPAPTERPADDCDGR